jgi:hypothetical protein
MESNIGLSALDGYMIMRLVRFDLDDSARNYVSDTFANGGVLSERLLRVLDLSRGRIFTLLPEGANRDAMKLYRWGGVLPQSGEPETSFIDENGRIISVRRTPTLEAFLKEVILGYIHGYKDRLVILEDVIAIPSDLKLTQNDLLCKHVLKYQNEVYYGLADGCAPEAVDAAIRAACTSWHFVGVFTKIVGVAQLRRVITEEMLGLWISNVIGIAVGAYDGEGFIFWISELQNGAELERCIKDAERWQG